MYKNSKTFEQKLKEIKNDLKKELKDFSDTLYAVRSSSQNEDSSINSFAGILKVF